MQLAGNHLIGQRVGAAMRQDHLPDRLIRDGDHYPDGLHQRLI